MWDLTLNIYRLCLIALITLLFALTPCNTFAAEVLQVRSSNLLQVGDRNRTFSVQIACQEINPTQEMAAMRFLKMELPRGTKVNLKPKGIENGNLIAGVLKLENDKDLGKLLSSEGFARETC